MLDLLDERCAVAMAEHGCPSLSVAVVQDGEVVVAEAYGWADVDAGRAATPGTAYAIASVTKPITATAVCLAAEEGLLQLDSPVPIGAGEQQHAPTVRQLLQHTGGLAAHYDFHYGDGRRRIDAAPYTVLRRKPGSRFEYANSGYGLLGRELEAVTGQPLEQFLRDRVFAPLGLHHFRLAPAHPEASAAAVRYTIDGRPYPPSCDTSHPAASMGWATAPELALFAQSYARLLKPGTAAATCDTVPVNARLGYGLGWCLSRGDGPVVRSHGGSMGGVAAMTVAVPEQRLSVAVLSNSTGKAARDAVVRYVMGDLVPGFAAEQISPALPDTSRPAALPHDSWSGRIGTPEGDVSVTLRLTPDGRAEVRAGGDSDVAQVVAWGELDLRGVFAVQLPTADARVDSPLLGLELSLEQGRMRGVARAYKEGDREGLLGSMLTHPCELAEASNR